MASQAASFARQFDAKFEAVTVVSHSLEPERELTAKQ